MKKIKNFTTFDIARLLDVYPTTVAKWIDEKRLKAFITPGGHRRVDSESLYGFLKKHDMPIPPELKHLETKGEKRVLIIDDNVKLSKHVEKELKHKDKKIVTFLASDGFQAGQAVSDFKPDVMLLDIMLPGMDGFKVCQLIREKDKKLKIIAITGYHSEEARKKILAAGADAYFKKPFRIDDLLQEIEALLSKETTEN
ncbi:MAG: response regulator [bacterium]|nr:response regulator [bacterium]